MMNCFVFQKHTRKCDSCSLLGGIKHNEKTSTIPAEEEDEAEEGSRRPQGGPEGAWVCLWRGGAGGARSSHCVLWRHPAVAKQEQRPS